MTRDEALARLRAQVEAGKPISWNLQYAVYATGYERPIEKNSILRAFSSSCAARSKAARELTCKVSTRLCAWK